MSEPTGLRSENGLKSTNLSPEDKDIVDRITDSVKQSSKRIGELIKFIISNKDKYLFEEGSDVDPKGNFMYNTIKIPLKDKFLWFNVTKYLKISYSPVVDMVFLNDFCIPNLSIVEEDMNKLKFHLRDYVISQLYNKALSSYKKEDMLKRLEYLKAFVKI